MSTRVKRPPKLPPAYVVGDVVQTGPTRWLVRNLRGDRVDLEASNVTPGIWWTTTLDHLPTKTGVSA